MASHLAVSNEPYCFPESMMADYDDLGVGGRSEKPLNEYNRVAKITILIQPLRKITKWILPSSRVLEKIKKFSISPHQQHLPCIVKPPSKGGPASSNVILLNGVELCLEKWLAHLQRQCLIKHTVFE